MKLEHLQSSILAKKPSSFSSWVYLMATIVRLDAALGVVVNEQVLELARIEEWLLIELKPAFEELVEEAIEAAVVVVSKPRVFVRLD